MNRERGDGRGERYPTVRSVRAARTASHYSRLPPPVSLALILALLALAACNSAGQDQVLAIEATGVARGLVYFDADGDREPAPPDTALAGVAVELVFPGGRGIAARVVSDSTGRFRAAGLPVGSYTARIDTATVPDSMAVVRIVDSTVVVPPGDSVAVLVALGFPRVTVRQARLAPLGAVVFVDGLALNAFATFGDSTVHVADTSGALRAVRVGPVPIFPGDSVRLRGTRGVRDGQPVLADVTAFLLSIRQAPPPASVTTALARTADGGRLDAALVAVTNATITDTATVGSDFRLTVSDGSGPLEVVLDDDANFTLTPFRPTVVIDATGLLVPVGPGVWRLKPRSDADVTVN